MPLFGVQAMARDIKINYNQLTLGKLRRMRDMLLLLPPSQLAVTIPKPMAQSKTLEAGTEAREVSARQGTTESGKLQQATCARKRTKTHGSRQEERAKAGGG